MLLRLRSVPVWLRARAGSGRQQLVYPTARARDDGGQRRGAGGWRGHHTSPRNRCHSVGLALGRISRR